MEKRTIALFIRGFHNGGIEKVYENFFSHMDLSCFEIHIITYLKNDKARKQLFEEMGCIIHEFSPMKGHKVCRRNIQEHRELFDTYQFDVVHNNMPEFLLPLIFAKKKKVPVRILHAHSQYTQTVEKKSKVMAKIYKGGFLINSRMANVLVAINKDVAESTFLSLGENAVILKNAIDISQFRFDESKRKEIRNQLELGDSVVLGHVGRYEHPAKNQALILKVFKELLSTDSNYKLIMIGEGRYRESIMNEARRSGIADKILFTGIVNNVHEYLMAMDIFLFPSMQEGLGIAAIEAEATGLPCIISEEVPKEVGITENALFVPIYGDDVIQQWVDKIYYFTEMLPSINRSEAFIQIKNAGYNIEDVALKLKDIYLKNSVN